MLKRFSVLIIAALFAVPAVMGQQAQSQSKDKEEMSIEESYLQEAIELMIIKETSRSNSRDQKMIALQHIGNAIERGSTNDELRETLVYLSLEGTQNQTRMGNRPINNFPDVRRQAVKYLGSVNTKESKDSLVKIVATDNEPMVLQEAIKSLGMIGMNDNNDAVNAILFVAKKNDASTAPDNMLALSAIETLEKFAEKYKTIDGETVQLLARISEGAYVPPVRERARQVLLNIRKYVGRS